MSKKSKDKKYNSKASIEKKAGDKADESRFEEMGIKLPKEAEKKLRELKTKLDKFQEKVVKKFDKYIMGIALLPPPMKPGAMPQMPGMPAMAMPPGQAPMPAPQMPPTIKPAMSIPSAEQKDGKAAGDGQAPKEELSVLVLVDDSDSQKMPKLELKAKLGAIIQKMAEEEDKNMVVQTIILSEIWQSCYDAKYEMLQMIALALPIFDTGMLAAIKIAEIHKTMVLKKFEKYIVSYVLAGSLVQGRAKKDSDIDVWIVIDDTDVKRMTRAELKDKLRAIIIGMGIEAGDLTGIKNKLNIQVYILTDFWDSLREANPIIFTLLRDGVPFYDRGTFMPWKQLLRMGKIKPSQEAIDMFMSTGDQMLKAVEYKIKSMGMEDIYYAILTPSQAAIMLYGFPPPAPSETADLMQDLFVKKAKLLEEEYITILRDNVKVRKDIEHGTKKELSGKELDQLLTNADKYLKRIKKLFEEIQKMKEEESIIKIYDTTSTVIRDALSLEGKKCVEEEKLVKAFEEACITTGKIPSKYLRTMQDLMKAKKDYEAKTLTKAEIDNVKKEANEFIRFMIEHIQRKRGRELERAKIRIKYGNDKFGEVLLLDETAFIIADIDAEEKEISKAKISKEGKLYNIEKSSVEEFEEVLSKVNIPPKVFIKEPIFEDLRSLFGRDVEILVNY
jgi:predicted nucleotidyltransferase/uncharacterized protein (UPF0332 family)